MKTTASLPNLGAIALGGIVAVLGLVAIVAWQPHILALVQMLPSLLNSEMIVAMLICLSVITLTIHFAQTIQRYATQVSQVDRQLKHETIERKQTESALRESEERFQAFMSNSPVVAFMKDEEGRYVYGNQRLEHVFGVKLSDIQGKTDFDWLPEETATQLRANDQAILASGKPAELLETVSTPNGNCHYLVFKFPFKDAVERSYVGGMSIDISDRIRAETELLENQTRLKLINSISTRTLLGMSVEQIIESTIKQISTYFNTLRVAYLTIAPQGNLTSIDTIEPQGMPSLKALAIDLIAKTEYLKVLRTNEPIIIEDITQHILLAPLADAMKAAGIQAILNVPFQYPDNSLGILWFDSPSSRKWSEHEIATLTETAQYLSPLVKNDRAQQERQRAETELREMSVALENAVEGISRLDAEERYINVNTAYANMLGYKPSEMIGMNWQATVHPEDRERAIADYRDMLGIGKVEATARAVRQDGSVFYQQRTMVSAYDEQQRFNGHYCFIKDITYRVEAEAALRHANDELEIRVGERTQDLANALSALQVEIKERCSAQLEQARLLEQLDAEREQLEAILNSMTDALIVGDLAENVLIMNPAALRFYQYPSSIGESSRHLKEYHKTFEVHDLDGNLIPVEKWPSSRALKGEMFSNYEVNVKRISTGKSWFGSYSSTPILNKAGEISLIILTIRDISDLIQFQGTLHESLHRFRFLANAMPQIVWTARPDGFLDYYNKHWYEFTGFVEGGGGDDSWKPILHPDDVELCLNRWYESVRTGEPYEIEYRFFDRKTNSYRWHLGQALPMHNEAGIVMWVGTCTDIHDCKEAQELLGFARDRLELKIQEIQEQTVKLQAEIADRQQAEERIKRSLQEKEVLLKEVHHRVKNNLQIISGLLYLQTRCIEDERTLQLLQENRNRIQSMALLHEKLYVSKNFDKIDFRDYIQSVLQSLFLSHGVNTDIINLKIEIPSVSLDIDTAIPCGLIVNELVSNALKYAFAPGQPGEIAIKFDKLELNKFQLVISDSGVGFREEIDFQSKKSLGLRLVHSLATKQLEGLIKVDGTNGAIFKISWQT